MFGLAMIYELNAIDMRVIPWQPYKLATAFLVIALTSACASVSREELSIDQLVQAAPAENSRQQQVITQSLSTLADRVAAQQTSHIDILMLSGGGQNGAYGMGFLRGWQQREDAPMPEFDIITGISTGALQVPFVAFNDPNDLERGADLFRNAANSFAPSCLVGAEPVDAYGYESPATAQATRRG